MLRPGNAEEFGVTGGSAGALAGGQVGLIIVLVLWSAWQRRKVGTPIDVASVVGVSACLFAFVAWAIVEVLTHQ